MWPVTTALTALPTLFAHPAKRQFANMHRHILKHGSPNRQSPGTRPTKSHPSYPARTWSAMLLLVRAMSFMMSRKRTFKASDFFLSSS